MSGVRCGSALVAAVREHPLPSAAWASVDLPRLRRVAHAHRASAFVARALDGADVSGPDADGIRADANAALVAHLRALADLAAAQAILDGLGTRWAAIKGPVLSEHVYRGSPLREYSDIDVVVPRAQFADAVDALEAGGARVLRKDWAVATREVAGELNLALPFGTALDLHWDVLYHGDARAWFRIPTDDILARVRRVSLGGGLDIPTFDPTDTVLHLGLHAARSGARRLIWLKDIERAVACDPPAWDVLVDRAHEWRIALPAGTALARSARVLGASVPRAVTGRLLPAPWRALTAMTDRFAPPQHGAGPSIGTVVAHAARADLVSSTRALAGGVAHALVGRRGTTPRASTDVDNDPAGRRAYLRSISNA